MREQDNFTRKQNHKIFAKDSHSSGLDCDYTKSTKGHTIKPQKNNQDAGQ